MGHTAIVFISLGIFYSLLIGVIIFTTTKNRKKVNKKLHFDKETLKQFARFNGTTSSYKEREYKAKYQKATKNTPPSFSISLKIRTSGIFKITIESSFDKFAKRINIAKEIQTGEHKFDERFYIDSSTNSFTQIFLSDNEIRDKITTLFDLGFTEISLKKDYLTVSANFKKSNIEIDENLIEEALDNLFVINDKLLSITDYQASSGGIITKIKVGFYSTIISLGTVGFIILIIGLIKYKPLDAGKIFLTSLIYSVLAFIIYIYYAVRLLRGRSSSHNDLITIFIIAFFSFIIAGYGSMIFFNGYFDKSMFNSHNVVIIKKYYTKTKNGKNYYSVVESWRTGRTFEKIRVSSKFFRQINVNSYMIINTKKGKFNYEWLMNYEKADFDNME